MNIGDLERPKRFLAADIKREERASLPLKKRPYIPVETLSSIPLGLDNNINIGMAQSSPALQWLVVQVEGDT
jgi:hypothetical protein